MTPSSNSTRSSSNRPATTMVSYSVRLSGRTRWGARSARWSRGDIVVEPSMSTSRVPEAHHFGPGTTIRSRPWASSPLLWARLTLASQSVSGPGHHVEPLGLARRFDDEGQPHGSTCRASLAGGIREKERRGRLRPQLGDERLVGFRNQARPVLADDDREPVVEAVLPRITREQRRVEGEPGDLAPFRGSRPLTSLGEGPSL